MKRILVITSREIFPIWGGDRLRIFNICKHLSKTHILDLVSLTDNKNFNYKNCPELTEVFKNSHSIYHSHKKAIANVLTGFWKPRSVQEYFYKNKELFKHIDSVKSNYDFVLCHLFRMEQYLHGFPEEQCVVELTDSLAMNYNRLRLNHLHSLLETLYFLEKKKVLKREVQIVNKYPKCCIISQNDKDYLVAHGAESSHLFLFNNGVDVGNFPNCYSDKYSNTIVFIGNIRAQHNLTACLFFSEKVMPLMRKNVREIKFKLIGNIHQKALNALSAFPYNEVTGGVENIGENVGEPLCAVCSVQSGAGIQNKILEYFALGIPVVSSSIGAEGLHPEAVENILIADSPIEYVHAIEKLQKSPILRKEMSNKGIQIAREHYSWYAKLTGYEKLF